MTPIKNTYDEISYTKHIYQQTQPNNLATIATLFGVQPPPVATCRVLEIGCASGINTIAMAQDIPNGEFTGIDYSEQQIKEGQNNIHSLGLQNITLKIMDIMDIQPDLGMFDYIVAHGVYSWVPAPVRDKILQICHHNLQPNGIAYLSYNIYPGWHIDHTLREMMLYGTRHMIEPQEKFEQAQALLKFFRDTIKHKYDSYSLWLKKELQHISKLDKNYFFHEYLEEDNNPVFFHEFIEHANRHSLQYLTDATTIFTSVDDFFPETLAVDLIAKEQYFDLLRNNPFRTTLLCHQHIAINRNIEANKISNFYIAAPLKPATSVASEQLQHDTLEKFENIAGESVLSVASPLLKAVCLCLGEVWPQNLSFDSLMERVSKLLRMAGEKPQKELGAPDSYQTMLSAEDINEVKTTLLEFYLKKIVELSVYPPQFTLTISEYPVASPVARLQSQQSKKVTNLRYEIFSLDFATRNVLKHLDGTHNRAALLGIIQKSIEDGDLILYSGEDKRALEDIDADELHNYLSHRVAEILQSLAKKAYLVA